jgi:p-aminobenzoyl-glutamate transporter AbgT
MLIREVSHLYIIIREIPMDKTLKSVLKRQIPFLVGGTITGTIMTYYYGFLLTIIINSIVWWIISYIVTKYYRKLQGLNDQKYLLQYAVSKIKKNEK